MRLGSGFDGDTHRKLVRVPLRELGSVSFDAGLRWPDMSDSWSGAFERIFDEFAPPVGKAEKRARAAMQAAIEHERARRPRSA